MRKPVIAIAGLACENSTFTPSRTDAAAFHPKRGKEIIEKYDFLHPGTTLSNAATWVGALIGHALPGGVVKRDSFELLAGEIVSRLEKIVEARWIDGLWFDIHGAMHVEGVEDVEAELLRRIRKVIGPHVLVSASMDLHGNVSRQLAHQTDLVTCYRTAPHIDVRETKQRACQNLVELIQQQPESLKRMRPLKAWVPLPVLLPGEQTSTRVEPASHIYAAVPGVADGNDVIDAAIWVGYAWADEWRNRAIVMVTGWEEATVVKGAEKLATIFWASHADFKFVAPTGSFKECLDAALASSKRPYFISDSGDNPTAGGSGDMTWGLHKLLARSEFKEESGPKVIYASVPGKTAVAEAVKAGVNATVTVTAGAEVDDIHAGPITLTGRVHSIKHGDVNAETEVVLQVGSVFVILTKLRKPYHKEHDFTDLDLKPRSAAIVIVKIGYLEPELYDMAADWMMALTPGGVDQDLERLGHHKIRRPMWPFDKKWEHPPDLTARLIPPSNEPLTGPDD
ncbi:Microcystinase C [Cyphellophora attinorum]|uniref:Microcystinase C n=1 Tax=Cyphellophora attinorum TaxID=1664694 RepID=A0A0N1HK15_9EURO|nr:Microcystinase C [Phialophora attinorum]KPI37000.1 Microcystinase C [Phialophora attinorum]